MPPFHNGWSATVDTLTGSDCGSAGSFCAVTVTVGTVTVGGAAGAWALATAGTSKDRARTEERMGVIMQRETRPKVPRQSHR
jgi:hypothetical protein